MYLPGEDHSRNETIREEIFRRTHESGLPVYLCPKPGFKKRYACFAADFGSVDSSFQRAGAERIEVPDGVAHFLEHKLFEDPDGSDAFLEFSARGASANAYTSFTTTNYLFSCSESFYENLGLLVRLVHKPHFTDQNVEKEKGIIGEEISMYDDSAGWRVYFNLLESLYHAHPIRKSILGTAESIGKITKELLYACYATFYHPQNMILFAVGDLDRAEFFTAVDGLLDETSHEPLGEVERFRPEEPPGVHRRSWKDHMVVSMPRLLVGFKDRQAGYGGRRLLHTEQVTDILLEIMFGKGSALFRALYAEELIDDSFSCYHTVTREVGYSVVGGETPDPGRVEARILEEVDRFRGNGIDGADFERQKRAAMGSLIRQFNSLEFIANNYLSYRFMEADLFDIIDVLHSLEVDDLEQRLREHLAGDSVAVSVLWPKTGAPAATGVKEAR